MGSLAFTETTSVCPECLRTIPAIRYHYGADEYLKKSCPDHGEFQTIIRRGASSRASRSQPKIPWHPSAPQTITRDGCPYDCGLCPEHRQQTCTALIEVTFSCNLGCRFCFARSGSVGSPDPDITDIRNRLHALATAGVSCNIQLSGGEPTLRDDLPDIIATAVSAGFPFVQLNTNGIRLGRDFAFTEQLKAAGLASVFLQFDGIADDVYLALRGQALCREKLAALEACAQNEIGVVLVPTVVPGVNDLVIGDIVRFGLQYLPVVRGVHCQPVSYFGRYPTSPSDDDRITIPEILRGLEDQTNGLVTVGDFKPPSCENARCSFSGSFVLMPDGELKSFSEGTDACSCGELKAEDAAEAARRFVAKQWKQPTCCSSPTTEPSDDSWSLGHWDVVLERTRTHSFSISGMAFQDAWTLDLDRLKDCCIHVVDRDGRLIPFCAYNLTDRHGRSLYSRGDPG